MEWWQAIGLGSLTVALTVWAWIEWLNFRDQKRLAKALLLSRRLAAIENGYVRADPKAFLVNPEGELLRLQLEDRQAAQRWGPTENNASDFSSESDRLSRPTPIFSSSERDLLVSTGGSLRPSRSTNPAPDATPAEETPTALDRAVKRTDTKRGKQESKL